MGAVAGIIRTDVARVESQVVSVRSTVGCGHPVVAAQVNAVELTCTAVTQAAGREMG